MLRFEEKIKKIVDTYAKNKEEINCDRIGKCIEKALNNKKIFRNIEYKGSPYNFNVEIFGNNFSYKYDWVNGGFRICIVDNLNNEIGWISILLIYDEQYKKKKRPYRAHIHRLGVKEAYRMKGYARYLICVSLLVAHMLDVQVISVHNTCEYAELYTLFKYRKTQIKEIN